MLQTDEQRRKVESVHKCEIGLKTGTIPLENFLEFMLVNLL